MDWARGVRAFLKLYVGCDFACKLNDPARVFLPLNENFCCCLFALNERFLLDRLPWKVFVIDLFRLSKFIYIDSFTLEMFGKLDRLCMLLFARLFDFNYSIDF